MSRDVERHEERRTEPGSTGNAPDLQLVGWTGVNTLATIGIVGANWTSCLPADTVGLYQQGRLWRSLTEAQSVDICRFSFHRDRIDIVCVVAAVDCDLHPGQSEAGADAPARCSHVPQRNLAEPVAGLFIHCLLPDRPSAPHTTGGNHQLCLLWNCYPKTSCV